MERGTTGSDGRVFVGRSRAGINWWVKSEHFNQACARFDRYHHPVMQMFEQVSPRGHRTLKQYPRPGVRVEFTLGHGYANRTYRGRVVETTEYGCRVEYKQKNGKRKISFVSSGLHVLG